MTPPNNSGLSEPETRAKFIDPAIHKRGWTEDMIRREETTGSIEVIGDKARRRSRGQVDYTLRLKIAPDDQPVVIALIEARKESLRPPTAWSRQGLRPQQVAACALCVFSSNGHQFVAYDRFTGVTTAPRPMAGFPPPEVLRRRYEQHLGFDLRDAAARPLLKPYHNGEVGRRYYQDAAIRAALGKIARTARRGESPRTLLALATGTGKTFIAVNLLKRITDTGQLRRALFLCDHNELRSQTLGAFQNVFGSDTAAVERNSDGSNHARNARVHIATYQTLSVDSIEHYPEDYFSHIVIDECHRDAPRPLRISAAKRRAGTEDHRLLRPRPPRRRHSYHSGQPLCPMVRRQRLQMHRRIQRQRPATRLPRRLAAALYRHQGGPSDFGCKQWGDGHCLRRPAFVLRPSRRALRAAPGLPQ